MDIASKQVLGANNPGQVGALLLGDMNPAWRDVTADYTFTTLYSGSLIVFRFLPLTNNVHNVFTY